MSVSDHEWVIVEIDGGLWGNFGLVGYGVVVCDVDIGEVFVECMELLGIVINNVVEYCGFIVGLMVVCDVGVRNVAVRVDFKLVVEQMMGCWQVKNEALWVLVCEVMALRIFFDAVIFEWIFCAHNKHADRFANEVMDQAVGVSWCKAAVEEMFM